MINNELYLKAINCDKIEDGAQELILGEIVGCLHDCKTIWLPYSGTALRNTLNRLGYLTICRSNLYHDECIDALYFGTPTIVDNMLLFPRQFAGKWTKNIERRVVKSLCNRAIRHGCYCIVCGLGEGDITADERISDIQMSSRLTPNVVSIKKFIGFNDIVIEAR